MVFPHPFFSSSGLELFGRVGLLDDPRNFPFFLQPLLYTATCFCTHWVVFTKKWRGERKKRFTVIYYGKKCFSLL